MANKITIDGVDYEIDLDNLASEATLKAFAESALRKDNDALEHFKKLLEAQKEATKIIEEQTERNEDALEILGRARAADNDEATGAMGKFGKGLFSIGSKLPILGTVLGGLVGAITGVVESVWKQARFLADIITDFNKSGVLFTGSMTDLIFRAGEAGMKLSELANLTNKNMMVMSRIGGGDISKGMVTFANAVTSAFRGVEGLTPGLATLGYTSAETGELMLTYLDIQDRINSQSMLSGLNEIQRQQVLTSGVSKFAKDLFELSRLTGKSRDELIGTITDISNDSEFLISAVASKNADGIQKTGAFLKSMSEELYESFISVLRFDSLTGAVDNNVMMMQLLGADVAQKFTQITRDLDEGRLTGEEANERLRDLFGKDAAIELRKNLARLPPEFTKNPSVQAMVKMTEAMRKATIEQEQAYKQWTDDNAGALEGMREEQKKAEYKRQQTEAQERNEQIGRSVRLFDAMLNRIRNAFSGIFIKIVDNKTFNKFMDEFTAFVESFFNAITTRIGPILNNDTLSVFEKIAEVFGVVIDELKEQLWPKIKPYWDKFIAGFAYMYGMMKADLYDMMPFGGGKARETRIETEREYNIAQGMQPYDAQMLAERTVDFREGLKKMDETIAVLTERVSNSMESLASTKERYEKDPTGRNADYVEFARKGLEEAQEALKSEVAKRNKMIEDNKKREDAIRLESQREAEFSNKFGFTADQLLLDPAIARIAEGGVATEGRRSEIKALETALTEYAKKELSTNKSNLTPEQIQLLNYFTQDNADKKTQLELLQLIADRLNQNFVVAE